LEPNGPHQSVTNAFILNNSVGTGRLLFVASHGKGPVSDVVISGNQLHKHAMTIDVVPPKDQRRKNWIIMNNTSDEIVHRRPIRLIDTDGVLVSGNTQRVTNAAPGVQLTNVCGGRVEDNDFGAGGVRLDGPICAAEVVIPAEPVIPGRT
jgi:hypothetical protein